MKVKFLLRNIVPLIITGLILSSCSKDSAPDDDLIGTWTMGSVTYNAKVGTKVLSQYLIEDAGYTTDEVQIFTALLNQQIQQNFTGTIQMKSDHTFTSTMNGISGTGTWSLSSDRKKLTIVSNPDPPVILDVIELTSSKLHLQGTETEPVDLNDDGTDEIITVTIDLNLTK